MTDSIIDLFHLECDEDEVEDGVPEIFVNSPYYSNEDAIKVLCNKNKSFSVLSLNCQSLFSKFDELQIYLKYYAESHCAFHVICLQETWLSADHHTNSSQLDGYNFIFKPKVVSQHG